MQCNTSIIRGQVFNKIDDQIITISNISSLLSNEIYSVGLAVYNDNGTNETDDDTISNTSETITLSKSVYYENPIFKAEVFNLDNENVAYLMYNGFIADYDSQLNIAFGNFQSQNIQHLVLDLRYNPGGSVNTAAIKPYTESAILASELGLGINAGHDLSLDNIQFFAQNIPNLLEVSIGHALIAESL